jgi:outer membrane usher protein FimD/PapC
MSSRAPAVSRAGALLVAALLLHCVGISDGFIAAAHAAPATAVEEATAAPSQVAAPTPPLETLIARVFLNTVDHGDLTLLRDADGRLFVPESEFTALSLAVPATSMVRLNGERAVALANLPGLTVSFDAKSVTLRLRVAAAELPGTTIDVGPRRRGNVDFPADSSVFLNYGVNATGDDSFDARRFQAATEFGARLGNWLGYSTSDYHWGDGSSTGYTRLLTYLQYDDRPGLRRWTMGDFFTEGFDLSSSVPMGGLSLTKEYRMDPYFVQYPTAAFRTETAFPSTVQVRVNDNVIAQRQVPPGPIDITNITTGVTGAQNVSVVIRDPFGREQVLQQPFFFATNVGLAEGLHEYSYSAGALREDYGIRSNRYGDAAVAAYHRYAFTNQLTLGLRGQATRDAYNIGPFGTYQFARLGVVAAGVSIGGGGDGGTGYAASGAYSWTGRDFSFNAGGRYFSRDFRQFADLTTPLRGRSEQYASASMFLPGAGSLTLAYIALDAYDGPSTRNANLSYTLGVLGTRGLLAVNYLRTFEPVSSNLVLLSFRYYFDRETSAIGALGSGNGTSTQSLSLQRNVPLGEGLGYDFTAGHAGGDDSGAFGRAFMQLNAAHAQVGAEYTRAPGSGTGQANVFVAGSIGAVGGSVFAARPVLDSFALVRITDLPNVPVYANGWFAGTTNDSGEVVATNINAYYDNFIVFGTRDLPLDYVFPSAERVISPPARSGTLVAFEIRRTRAVFGVLAELRDGRPAPLEFRELTLTRDAEVIKGFTARRGEFYVEGVEPGVYTLRLGGATPCSATVRVPEEAEAIIDVGTLICATAAS